MYIAYTSYTYDCIDCWLAGGYVNKSFTLSYRSANIYMNIKLYSGIRKGWFNICFQFVYVCVLSTCALRYTNILLVYSLPSIAKAERKIKKESSAVQCSAVLLVPSDQSNIFNVDVARPPNNIRSPNSLLGNMHGIYCVVKWKIRKKLQ